MKKFMILSMAGLLMVAVGCSRDNEQDIQREEELNREDVIEDSTYDQSDIAPGTGAAPSDLDTQPDAIESQESDVNFAEDADATETLEE